MKNFFKNMLKSIEDANKQNFGKKKMDCCDLNQGSNGNNKNAKQDKSSHNSAKH
ncbi:LDCC motif putative metal-binding protein [Isachenkonia alkalipeptolytica]|uniref:LDCC motif putative metal-binding protein n=1 Tax=Isachenkonia alkalipeptolytica TaxID=2565777 RepID=UPI00191BFB17|nr:LDCC motif putative metal-binding protein [Isachenkonia alkalipeptolytica]